MALGRNTERQPRADRRVFDRLAPIDDAVRVEPPTRRHRGVRGHSVDVVSPSFGRHPGCGVETYHLTVEHLVLDDRGHQMSEVFSGAETLREHVEFGE